MNGHYCRTLYHEQNLFAACPCFDSGADVASRSNWVEVRASHIQTDTDDLDKLGAQNPFRPGIRRHFHALLRPGWIPFLKLVEGCFPRTCRLPRPRGFRRPAFACHHSSPSLLIFDPICPVFLSLRTSALAVTGAARTDLALFVIEIVCEGLWPNPGRATA